MKTADSKNKIAKQSDTQIDKKQILSAIKVVKTLYEGQKGDSNNLLELNKNPFIYMNFIVNKLADVNYYKDTKLTLANSIHGNEFETRVLFILTNEFKEANSAALKQITGNWKFIRYDKIKKNFKEYKDKRGLLNNYDLFFCDKALVSSLKKSLGTKFFDRKKYPLPVDLSPLKSETQPTPQQLQSFFTSLTDKCTYLHLGQGTEFSVKIGRAHNMSDIDVLKNALCAFKEIVRALKPLGLSLKNVRRVVIRAEQSESLPVYSYLTEEERQVLRKVVGRQESK